MTIQELKEGWFLPADDSYFARFKSPPEYGEAAPDRNGFYREHLFEALKHVKRWDHAIDVGAHVGWWCWDIAKRFKTVYAFEASPDAYQCLVRNLKDFNNVIACHVAVGSSRGRCSIMNDKTRKGNSGSNYVMPGHGDIKMVSLDEMNIPGCDFLKIDVEGFELRVLEGARKIVKRYRPVICMETTDFKFKDRYGIPPGAAQSWLVDRGYRIVAHMRPDTIFVPR